MMKKVILVEVWAHRVIIAEVSSVFLEKVK